MNIKTKETEDGQFLVLTPQVFDDGDVSYSDQILIRSIANEITNHTVVNEGEKNEGLSFHIK